MRTPGSDADVLVVGAGLAGLAAARELRRAGKEPLVLEATRRVGGRAHSVRLGEATANLGGEWVGRRHRRVRGLVDGLGLRLEPSRFLGSRIRWRAGIH